LKKVVVELIKTFALKLACQTQTASRAENETKTAERATKFEKNPNRATFKKFSS